MLSPIHLTHIRLPPHYFLFHTTFLFYPTSIVLFLFKEQTMSEDKKSLKFPSHNWSRVELTFLVVVPHFENLKFIVCVVEVFSSYRPPYPTIQFAGIVSVFRYLFPHICQLREC